MISVDTLDQIAEIAVSSVSLNDDVLAALKDRWPELRFTLCNDDDMPARLSPALQQEKFNLYLVGGSEHCLSLTDDPLQAIGVVLAEVDAI